MITYSEESDAVDIQISDAKIVRTQIIDDARIVDYDTSGYVVGIKLLGASRGLDLRGLPEQKRLESEARVLNFPIFA